MVYEFQVSDKAWKVVSKLSLKESNCNKYKSVTKYISVFAPGTQGIYQTLIWSQLAIGS